MNAWVQSLGIDALKPFLAALLLPPVPWLVLIALGALALFGGRRRRLGALLVATGIALEWASCTAAAADRMARWLLQPPEALGAAERSRLGPGGTVIVVLGGGRTEAAEYPQWTLSPISMERLRYGVWLSRETGVPLAFSGGLSPGSREGPSEGEIATRIAAAEFGHPLAWAESRSRDTAENATRTIDLLRPRRIERLVLVTHDLHMRRALGHFARARDAAGMSFALIPAPVGQTRRHDDWALSDYYPTPGGTARMRYVLREWLGLLAGA